MKKILAIAANPDGTSRLRLDREIRDIRSFLQQANYSGEFCFEDRTAARWEDLHRAILDVKPRIVHFCGHGTGEAGLLLERDCGQQFVMSTDVLSALFKTQQVSNTVECVVLNACYSAVQAKTIAQHINYVIGMNKAIPDEDAIAYAKGFYLGLSTGASIPDAHEQGLVSMKAEWSGNGFSRDVELPTEAETDNALGPELYIKEKLTSFPNPCGKPENEKLKEGFDALSNLLANPKAYEAAIVFRADFKTVYSQVNLLSYYKQLHDLLQEVETTCYWPMIRHKLRYKQEFMVDEDSLEIISQYEMNLQSSITKICNVVEKRPEEIDEQPSWLRKLKDFQNKLETAIELFSDHEANHFLRRLGSILSNESTSLNANITSIAKALRLRDLINGLSVIRDKIVDEGIDESDSISKFEAGILSLSRVSECLGALVKEHDSWQRVDADLRVLGNRFVAESLIEEALYDLPDLQERVERLCQYKSGSEISRLEKCSQSLHNALALNQPTKVRSSFYRYHAAALDVFVQVDLDLLYRCKELREIRTALAPVMEKLS